MIRHVVNSAASHVRHTARDERGGISVYLVGVLVVVLVIGYVIMVPLGDAVADRRNANTASDAAALAGADYCADKLEKSYKEAVASPDGKGFWSHFGKPVSTYCTGVSTEASRYASKNDASLTSFTPLSGLRYRASVRMNDEVEEIGKHIPSTAMAEMTMDEGMCVSEGLLGVRAEGRCQTAPTKFKSGPDDPERPIGYASEAKVSTRLVAS